MYEIWAGDFDYLHDRLDEGFISWPCIRSASAGAIGC